MNVFIFGFMSISVAISVLRVLRALLGARPLLRFAR